jgi:NADH:ubiquinone oxidoreductase subunit 5 (subunit L)/multisubunit Na+/H+ antiporter MnhA subunit
VPAPPFYQQWITWAVPLLMLVLLFTFVLLVLGVRTRRASAGLGMAAFAIGLVALVVITAARFGVAAPYVASYEWMNLQVAVSGAVQFQNLIVDLDLRLDHFAIAQVGTILVTGFFVLAWSRSGARAEPGVPRLHILIVMFVLGAVGVALTPNLAGLIAYWGVAAIATYLMYSNRWGTPETGAARWTLALPITGDLAILAGASLLYSRYGELDLSRLPGLVHTTPGAGLKSLTAACILLVAGAAVRAGVPPLQGWLTGTTQGPAAASAIVQGLWGLVAGGLVFRVLPLVHLAGWQAAFSLAVLGAMLVVLATVLSVAGNDLRRAVAYVGIAAVGLGFIALAYGDSAHALTGLLAGAPLRAGMVLAAAAVVAAMRSSDLAEMGGGRRRMRWTALTLLLGAVGLPGAFVMAGATAFQPAVWQLVFAAGLLLLAFAALRVYLGVANGTLERRRAFEPARVRDAVSPLRQLAFLVGAFGWLYVLLAPVNRWVTFLLPKAARRAAPLNNLEIGAVVVIGLALAIVTYGLARAASLRRSGLLGARVEALRLRLSDAADRWALAPLRAGTTRLDLALPAAEGEAISPLLMAGRLANRAADAELPLGWVALALAVAAVGALLAALLSPGVVR